MNGPPVRSFTTYHAPMHLSMYVFGLDELEDRELLEMLTDFKEVEEVEVRLSSRDLRPGTIYASAEVVHYAIKLTDFVVASLLTGLLTKAGEDIYLVAKELIRDRVRRWVEARNAETQRERIRFTMTENGEMVVALQARAQAVDEGRNSR